MKDIHTDKDLVEVIDELLFRLKTAAPPSPMRIAFKRELQTFVHQWRLDSDQHAFATLPAGWDANGAPTGEWP